MRLAAVLTAAILTASGTAQDSREAAARLHALVDRRIEELRADLHREIDTAMEHGDTTQFGMREPNRLVRGLRLQPVSEEFRDLHRIEVRCGLRVLEAATLRLRFGTLRLEKDDAIILADGNPVRTADDLAHGLFQWSMWCSGSVNEGVAVIRHHEWVRLSPESQASISPQPPRALPQIPALETADQMVDRLWEKAVRDAMKGGFEQLNPGNPVSESQPPPK